jgi:hypothetical protein
MKTPEAWIIRHKLTGEQFVARSGKKVWKAKNHAKAAWSQMSGEWTAHLAERYGVPTVEERGIELFPKFDQQDVYEVVKLTTESESNLDEAKVLLELCLGQVDEDTAEKIKEFLGEFCMITVNEREMSFEVTLFDNRKNREKSNYMGALEIMLDDSDNPVPEEFLALNDDAGIAVPWGAKYKITVEAL